MGLAIAVAIKTSIALTVRSVDLLPVSVRRITAHGELP